MKVWLTADEIAQANLPGLPATKRRVNALADRGGWAEKTSLVRLRAGRGGGIEYHIDLLPDAARAFYAAQTIGAVDVPVALQEQAADEETDAPLNAQASEGRDARLILISLADAYAKKAALPRHLSDDSFAALYNMGQVEVQSWILKAVKSLTSRTLRRWRSAVSAGNTTALGVDRGAARRGRGLLDVAENGRVKTFVLAAISKQTHLSAWHVKQLIADKFGLSVPVRTVQTALAAWRVEYRAELLAMTNPDAYKSQYRLTGRGTHRVNHLNELWMIDASPADVMLKDGRSTVYVCIDVYSRRLMIYVSKTPRASAVGLLIRRAIMAWGVPQRVKTDNGSDFIAKSSQRLFASLGIENERSDAFSPEQKGHIERAIGTMQRGLMATLPGFIGHNVTDRKAIEGRKAFAQRLGQDPKDAFCVDLDMAELQAYCDRWANEAYAHRPHAGLNGTTPFAATAAYAGPIKKITDERALDMLLAPVAGKDGLRVVSKSGLRANGFFYLAPELAPETPVLMRMDPVDMGKAYLFTPDGEAFLCYAVCPELSGIDAAAYVASAKRLAKDILDARTADIKREQRAIKSRDIVDATLRQAAKDAGALVEFPRRAEPYNTNALGAASEASNGPLQLTNEPFVNQQSAKERALQAEIEADLAAGRDFSKAAVRELLANSEKRLAAQNAEIEAEIAGQQNSVPANITPLRRAATAKQRMARANDIRARQEAAQPVTEAELAWVNKFLRDPEYIAALTSPQERYRHVLFLDMARKNWGALWSHEETWLKNYLGGAEYKSMKIMVEDFGEAALR